MSVLNDLLDSTTMLLWYKDPSKFFEDVFGFKPYPYQSKVLNELADTRIRRVLICASGGSGKTKLVASHALWLAVPFAIQNKRSVTIVIISGSRDQARTLYGYIKDAIQNTPLIQKYVDGEVTQSSTKFKHGSSISAVPNSHKAIQSLHKDVVIIDEPSIAGDFVIDDAKRIVVKDNSLDRIILLGTPFIPPETKNKSTKFVDMWEDPDKYPEWKRYHWCYDEKTEYLTKSGWKTIHYIDKNEEIAIVENGIMKWEIPKLWNIVEYSGNLISLRGKHLDLLVTPNHKIWSISSRGNYGFVEAKDFLTITKYARKFPRTVSWNGNNLETVRIGNYNFDTKLFMFLFGCIINGGKVDNNEIILSVNPKSELYDFLVKSLAVCFDTKPLYDRKTSKLRIECNKELSDFLLQELNIAIRDGISRWIRELGVDYLLELVKGIVSINMQFTNRKSTLLAYRIESSSKQLIESIQEICIKLGFTTSIISSSNKHILTFSNSNSNAKLESVEEIYYSGIVSCPSTSSGVILVRRNNKVVCCGNSAFDCPNVSPEQIEEAKKTLSEEMFSIFWLGKPYFVGESLIQFSDLRRASIGVKTYYDPALPSIAGVDWGYKDPTVLTIVQVKDGIYHVILSESWNRQDFENLHDRIEQYCNDYKVEKIYTDAEDVGENQRLQARGLNVIPISFNKYKTAMQSRLQTLFRQGKIKIDEEMVQLKEQLRKYNWDTHTNDDRVDSLMLAVNNVLEKEEIRVSPYWEIL